MRQLLCLIALAWAGLASAQTYPARPITLVVPYPPGGLIDLVARIVQPQLQAELGGSIAIENKSGAGGNVGAEAVARSAPDGYTMLLGNPSLALSQHIYPKLNYKPLEDLAFAGQYGTVPNVLVVNQMLPVKSVPELIAYAKKNPGKLNYGSPGYGTSPQMSMELFKGMTGTFILHIPFRGAGPATAALFANDTQLMFDNLPPQMGNIKSGRVRAIGVSSLKRVSVLPDVPTLDEMGLKGYEVSSWFGINVRAGTPPEIIARINQALNRATADAKVREQLESRGATVIQGPPEQYLAFVRAESAKWAPVVKRANIVAE